MHNRIVYVNLAENHVFINARMIRFWEGMVSSKKEKKKINLMLYDIIYNFHKEDVFLSDWLLYMKDTLDKDGLLNHWDD